MLGFDAQRKYGVVYYPFTVNHELSLQISAHFEHWR